MGKHPPFFKAALAGYAIAPLGFACLLPWGSKLTASLEIAAVLLVPLALARSLVRLDKRAFWGVFSHAGLVTALVGLTSVIAPSMTVALALTAFTCGLTALFMLHPDRRAPFMRDEQRGFRRHPRYRVSLRASVQFDDVTVAGSTLDISKGGAYIAVESGTRHLPTPGAKIVLELSAANAERLRCFAHVVGMYPNGREPYQAGFSVAFSGLTPRDLQTVTQLIKSGRPDPRPLVQLPVELYKGEYSHRSMTLEASLDGCFVGRGHDEFQPGDRIGIRLGLQPHNLIECTAQVVWSADAERPMQPPGIALRFLSLADEDAVRLEECLDRLVVNDLEMAA